MPRFARAHLAAPQSAGSSVELPLPQIERQVIIPSLIFITSDQIPDASMMVAISHNLSIADPANMSFIDDASIWIFVPVLTSAGFIIDMRGFGIELGGPQRLVARNEDNATRNFHLLMWYDTKEVRSIEWAAIVRRTSYED